MHPFCFQDLVDYVVLYLRSSDESDDNVDFNNDDGSLAAHEAHNDGSHSTVLQLVLSLVTFFAISTIVYSKHMFFQF
jgi:hypothetical protein